MSESTPPRRLDELDLERLKGINMRRTIAIQGAQLAVAEARRLEEQAKACDAEMGAFCQRVGIDPATEQVTESGEIVPKPADAPAAPPNRAQRRSAKHRR